MEIVDLPVGIERYHDGSVVSAPRAENFVGAANPNPDFVGGLNRNGSLVIEKNGVCFVIVTWNRGAGESVHPLGGIAGVG
jgi:hypothetical protein